MTNNNVQTRNSVNGHVQFVPTPEQEKQTREFSLQRVEEYKNLCSKVWPNILNEIDLTQISLFRETLQEIHSKELGLKGKVIIRPRGMYQRLVALEFIGEPRGFEIYLSDADKMENQRVKSFYTSNNGYNDMIDLAEDGKVEYTKIWNDITGADGKVHKIYCIQLFNQDGKIEEIDFIEHIPNKSRTSFAHLTQKIGKYFTKGDSTLSKRL